MRLVVTQAPKGQSPVERVARGHNIPVYKPNSLRSAEARQPLVDVDADLFVVAAFGLIFYGAMRLSREATDRFASIPLSEEVKDPFDGK